MLGTINPTLLKSEEKFSSFLEPIPIGTRAGQTIKELFPMKLEWRREVDHYQTSVEMQSKPEDFDL
jgi:ubiquinone biosynthesis protein Coq4